MILTLSKIILGVIPLTPHPVWESVAGFYSTGGVFCDINRDGWVDLFVGNGNDMEMEPNHIFFNQNGTLEIIPSWQSMDLRYSAHVAAGDLDKNGFIDLVVSNYSGYPNWQNEISTVYLNFNGVPVPYPSWVPQDSFISFGCALGDFDNDGDLDLAFACGERYSNQPQRVKLYRNLTNETNGQILFPPTPFWESAQPYNAYSILFGDINRDGWLDLVLGIDGGPNLIFHNQNGVYPFYPTWQSLDQHGTIQIALGDLNNDGFHDLATADNAQLGGISKVRVYMNINGNIERLPSWENQETRRYFSTVAFCDLNNDGYNDLAAGGWWEPVGVYENSFGVLSPTMSWSYMTPATYHLVCEKISFGDVDNQGIITVQDTFYLNPPGSGALSLKRLPTQILSIKYLDPSNNWVEVPYHLYSWQPHERWITVSNSLPPTSQIVVTYKTSASFDLLVTNWAPVRGNFLFRNTSIIVNEIHSPFTNNIQVFPNPFKTYINILTPQQVQSSEAKIFDRNGKLIMSFTLSSKNLDLSHLKSGIYFLIIPGYTPLQIMKL